MVIAIATGAILTMDIVVTTLVQREVPRSQLGRAMGLLQLTAISGAIAGSLVAPAVAEWLGLPQALALVGLILLGSSAAAVVVLGRQGSLRARTDLDTVLLRILRRTILVGASANRLEMAAREAAETTVAAGAVVIRQGDPADLFYLIADGRFRVTQDGPDGTNATLRELGPGDPFGEIGLLTGSARTATVTALTEARLFVLDQEQFLDLVGSGPDLSSGLLGLYRGGMSRAS